MRSHNLEKNRSLTLALTVAIIFLLQSIGSITSMNDNSTVLIVHADTTTSIVVDEDFTLTNDLVFSSGHGLIIGANDITIDGAGYKITGNKTVESCSWITRDNPAADTSSHGILNSGYDNIVIKNLEIENFATGIYLHGTSQNKILNVTITDCAIHDNGLSDMTGSTSESVTHGIHAIFSRNIKITNNDIYNNEGTGEDCDAGGNGIYIRGGGSESDHDYNLILNNKLHHNAKSGFWTNYKMDNSEIKNNELWENGNGQGITDLQRGGIILRCRESNSNIIQNNTVHDNYGDGIFIGGNSNELIENTVENNIHHGVNLGRSDGSEHNILSCNIICSNQQYDICNVHENYGGDNNGDENTGHTSHNYRDEGTTGNTYFTYSCPHEDTNPPDTTIISGPGGTIDYNNVTFSWIGSDDITSSADLQYSYYLEGKELSWSSWTYSTSNIYYGLNEKSYVFKVKTKDEAGNIDPTPAEQSFTIEGESENQDTTPPTVEMLSGPSDVVNTSTVQFIWTGSDETTPSDQLRYKYMLEGIDTQWSQWTTSTSKTYYDLINGSYAFRITVKDNVGNTPSQPISITFTVCINDGKTRLYDVKWILKQDQVFIDKDIFASKKESTISTIQIDKFNLKTITFSLKWKDDFVFPVLHYGKDEMDCTILDPTGEELYTHHSKGNGTFNFKTPTINQPPSISHITSYNIIDAQEVLSEYHKNKWKNESLQVEVTVNIGEKSIIRKLRDKGNSFHLTVTYEYYEANLTEIKDTKPPDTEITSAPSDVTNKSTITFKWKASDDITPEKNLRYQYILEDYDSKWSDFTQKKTKTYTDLPEGNYTFKVRAKDESGNVDETPAQQSFTIQFEEEIDGETNDTVDQKNNENKGIGASSHNSETRNQKVPGFEFLSFLLVTLIVIIIYESKKIGGKMN